MSETIGPNQARQIKTRPISLQRMIKSKHTFHHKAYAMIKLTIYTNSGYPSLLLRMHETLANSLPK